MMINLVLLLAASAATVWALLEMGLTAWQAGAAVVAINLLSICLPVALVVRRQSRMSSDELPPVRIGVMVRMLLAMHVMKFLGWQLSKGREYPRLSRLVHDWIEGVCKAEHERLDVEEAKQLKGRRTT